MARAVPGICVVDEPTKRLVVAREAGRRATTSDILAYVDADCRVPLQWLERIERRFQGRDAVVAVTGPYRFYDWDVLGRMLIRAYDHVVAPPTHSLVHYGLGAAPCSTAATLPFGVSRWNRSAASIAALSFMERIRTSAAA